MRNNPASRTYQKPPAFRWMIASIQFLLEKKVFSIKFVLTQAQDITAKTHKGFSKSLMKFLSKRIVFPYILQNG
ncbi:hypothetical protein DVG78_29310 [Runella aurantiaca]|uniref:Uncharacterized protein n=1 Tax=Runella aurantiaca TaxID=2282308 RepID=A0A369I1H9_9BACT|nr:hypothetical protein DVG78_29310 [Runella aurantiaca]